MWWKILLRTVWLLNFGWAKCPIFKKENYICSAFQQPHLSFMTIWIFKEVWVWIHTIMLFRKRIVRNRHVCNNTTFLTVPDKTKNIGHPFRRKIIMYAQSFQLLFFSVTAISEQQYSPYLLVARLQLNKWKIAISANKKS